jgi:hypothetical protein
MANMPIPMSPIRMPRLGDGLPTKRVTVSVAARIPTANETAQMSSVRAELGPTVWGLGTGS